MCNNAMQSSHSSPCNLIEVLQWRRDAAMLDLNDTKPIEDKRFWDAKMSYEDSEIYCKYYTSMNMYEYQIQ